MALTEPGTLDGVPVISIGEEAFRFCSSLSSITLPEGLKCIEKEAFSSCSSLSIITLPAGLEVIGEEAFSWCYALSSVSIPASVVSIEDGAFSQCSDDLVLTVVQDSYAHQWAEDHEYPYTHPDAQN